MTPCLHLAIQLLYTRSLLQHCANRHKSQQIWTMVIVHICSFVVQAAHKPGMIQTADLVAEIVQYVTLLELCGRPFRTVMDCKNISHAELAPLQCILQGWGFIVVFVIQQINASIINHVVCTTEVCQVKCNVPTLKVANCRFSRFVIFMLDKGDSAARTKQYTGRILVTAGSIRNSGLYRSQWSQQMQPDNGLQDPPPNRASCSMS